MPNFLTTTQTKFISNSFLDGMTVYLADVKFWHRLSAAVAASVAADATHPLTEYGSSQRRRN